MEQGARQGQQLPLARRPSASAFGDPSVELTGGVSHKSLQLGRFEGGPHGGVAVSVERVQVEPNLVDLFFMGRWDAKKGFERSDCLGHLLSSL